MTRTDTAAPAAAPADLVLRGYAGESDLEAVVRLLNAEYEADRIPERRSIEGERAW